MNETKDLEIQVVSKTIPDGVDSVQNDELMLKTVLNFFDALSEYVSFLEHRSAGTTTSDANLFAPTPDFVNVSLSGAVPVAFLAEAVESLKGYEFHAFAASSDIHRGDLEAHLQTLQDLWNMAADCYRNFRTLEILDQQIILLQAIVLLTPPSPSRDVPCLKLGEALTARFSHTKDLSDLDEVIAYYREAHLVQIDPYVLMLELSKSTRMRFKRTQRDEDLDETMNILRQMLSEMPPSHRFRIICLHNLGSLMMEQYKKQNRDTFLEDAITCYREAMELCNSTMEDMDNTGAVQTIVASLSSALTKRHEVAALKVDAKDVVNVLQGFLSLDLDTGSDDYNQLSHILTKLISISRTEQYTNDMVSVIRKFISLKPSSDIQRYLALHSFCTISISRFSASQSVEDISEAIAAYRDTLIYPAPIEVANDKVASIEILAGLLGQRYQLFSAEEDAQEIIAIYRDILSSLPLNDQASVMKDYADFLRLRFEKHRQLEDREEALLLYRDALKIVSGDDTKMSTQFDLLVDVSQTLLLGEGNDEEQEEQFRLNVDEAINHLEIAMSLPGCDSPENFTSAKRLLSACLLARYEFTHDPIDLNASVELTKDDEESYDVASELRDTMVLDIAKIHDAEELGDVVNKRRQSLQFQPFPHPSRPETLTSLGKALASQFKLGGPKKRLEEAILRLREAVLLSPKSIVAMITLADVLFQKAEVEGFHSTGHYMEEMMDMLRKCIPLFPKDMGGVAETMRLRVEEQLANHDSTTLDTISIIRDINEIGNKDPFEAARSLSFVYWMTFTISDDIKDLNECIHHSREAAINCPDDHPRGAVVFHDFGTRLLKRYGLLNDMEDLDEALGCYLKSIQILPPGSYYKSIYFGELGMAMLKKLDYFVEAGEEEMSGFSVLINAISALFHAGAMNSASPVPDRFRAAKVWAVIADLFSHESALEAYQQAIDLLPRLSSMGTNVTSRQTTFRVYGIDGLSRKAALFAIRVGKYAKAVEFLEAGRAVFWLQALQLRNPMDNDNLRDRHPDLHSKLSRISAELEKASLHMTVSRSPGNNAEQRVQDEEIFRLEELNDEWVRTLDEIHNDHEFSDFLLPQSLPKLQASIDCPVIFLIPDEHQSHALIMFSDNVSHVDLVHAAYEKLQILVSKMPGTGSYVPGGRFRGAMDDLLSELEPNRDAGGSDIYHRQERKGGPRHFKHVDTEDEIKYVLEALWNDVVGPIIQELGPRMTGSLLKVCWCPTGIFSFLPLHAAGIYGKDMSSIECTFDYLISSYTPTVGALSHKAIANNTPDEFKMMVVIDPTRLPNTIYEMTAIEQHVDTECLLRMGTQESPAFVEKIASNLSDVSIVHFACHGMQNEQPLDSSLILQDGVLKISRIMEERMPRAALAFLCACETAMGDKNLPDEAMHLGATLLYSGFKGVVATMWSIDDEDGPIVADRFYARLFKDDPKKPNTALAAEAVHDAITFLRQRQVEFKRWVPFIHLGL